MIDADGSIRGIYDKVHLVPFGEYLPFQRLLERIGLMQLTKVVGGFLSGDRRRAMDVGAAPKMLPLICYEAIFPGAAVPPASDRAGSSTSRMMAGSASAPGPYQHFQQARVLAIAEGLPLVRAANTRHFGGHRSGRSDHQRAAVGSRRRARLPSPGSQSNRPSIRATAIIS